MSRAPQATLSRRERQIMDVLYERGTASVADVLAALPDPPSYSAVRAPLGVLEDKGHVQHVEERRAYVYHPAVPRTQARTSAVQRLVRTFFDGSPTKLMAALLDRSAAELSEAELDEMAALIARAAG